MKNQTPKRYVNPIYTIINLPRIGRVLARYSDPNFSDWVVAMTGDPCNRKLTGQWQVKTPAKLAKDLNHAMRAENTNSRNALEAIHGLN